MYKCLDKCINKQFTVHTQVVNKGLGQQVENLSSWGKMDKHNTENEDFYLFFGMLKYL